MKTTSGQHIRYHLSSSFLFSAYHSAVQAAEVESIDTLSELDRLKHRSYVISAITDSVSFLEATIKELFTIADENPADIHIVGHPTDSRFRCIGTLAIQKLAAFWQIESVHRYGKLLEKYQVALQLANKSQMDEGCNPFQDTKLLTQLRNRLIHFKPEKRELATGTGNTTEIDNFESRYFGKFPINPIANKYSALGDDCGPIPADHPFFPEKCLGSGCAFWAFETANEFSNEFFSQLGTTWHPHWLFDRELIPKSR